MPITADENRIACLSESDPLEDLLQARLKIVPGGQSAADDVRLIPNRSRQIKDVSVECGREVSIGNEFLALERICYGFGIQRFLGSG